MYGLNRTGRHLGELEEAWLVQALVREDGLSQIEVAVLLGRHKSWVCRRLAMMEKRCAAAQEDLRLGLLSPTMARQLTRLPAGNQQEVLETGRRDSLTAAELRGVVDLLLASGMREEAVFVLEQPRAALREAQAVEVRGWDPRLSAAGNRVSRQLSLLLDQLARMANWLRHQGRGDLAMCDRGVLEPAFVRLAGEAQVVAEVVYRTVDSEGFVAYGQNRYSTSWQYIGQVLPLRITDDEVTVYSPRMEVLARHHRFGPTERHRQSRQAKHLPPRDLKQRRETGRNSTC